MIQSRVVRLLSGTTLSVMGMLIALPSATISQTTNQAKTIQISLNSSQKRALVEAKQLMKQAAQYKTQGNYAQAEVLYKQALAIRERILGPRHSQIVSSLIGLSKLYTLQNKNVQAEPLLERAIAMGEQVLKPDAPNLGTAINDLALIYLKQGNYSQAEPLYQRSLSIFKKRLGPKHPHVAISIASLALIHHSQGNYAKAGPLYRQALSLIGPDHYHYSSILNNLGVMYQAQGDNTLAEPLLKKALAIDEKRLGANHRQVANSVNNLAVLYQALGNYAEAERLYQQTLAIDEKTLGVEHPSIATTLSNLSSIYQIQGDYAQAIEFQTRSDNIAEKNLELILATASEARKRAYLAKLSGTTDASISLHIQDAPNNPQAARLALTTVLRRKGRVLDALIDSLKGLRQNLTPEDQKLLDQLAAVRAQLARLVFQEEDQQSPEQDNSDLAGLRAKAEQLESQLSRRSAEFRTQTQPVTLSDIQPLIPSDAALVELVKYKPFNPKASSNSQKWRVPHYAAYILRTQDEPQWVDLG